MSNGAITLQCPNCHGVFLTLHQRTEGLETCPHCAVAVMRSQFAVVQEELLHRAKVQLPARRFAERLPSIPTVVPAPPAPVDFAPLAPPVPVQASVDAPPIPDPPSLPAPPVVEVSSAPAVPTAHPLSGGGSQPPPLTPFGTPAPARFFPEVPAQSSPGPKDPLAPAYQQPPVLTETISFDPAAPKQGGFPLPPLAPPQPITPPYTAPVSQSPASTPPLPTQPSPAAPPKADSPPPFFAFAAANAIPPNQEPANHLPTPADHPAGSPFQNFGAPPETSPAVPPIQTAPTAALPGQPSTDPVMGSSPPNPATPPPAWPGLGLAVEPGSTSDKKGKPGLKLQPIQAKSPASADSSATSEPKPESRVSAVASLLAIAVLAFLGWAAWHLWEKPARVVVQAGSPSIEQPTDVTPTPPTPAAPLPTFSSPEPVAPAPQPTPPSPTLPAAPEGSAVVPPMPEETRRAVPATENAPAPLPPVDSTPEVTFETSAAQKVMEDLDDAESMEERLSVIADPEKHIAEVERFFANLNGHIDIGVTEPNPGNLIETASQQKVQLFRTMTRRCPTGAMIRLHAGKDMKPLLDWPLFIQSHNYLYDTFANSSEDRDQKPRWFTVLCKRSHDFELKAPEKDFYISLNAQGSLSSAGTTKVYVHKDSVAGRYLDSRMNWDATYLSKVLLGKVNIGEKTLTVILDCSGASVEH